MDIGGTRARIYEFFEGCRLDQLEIELPLIDSSLSEVENGERRVKAISRLVSYFGSKHDVARVATACAGMKNEERTGVTLLNFAVPLPALTTTVQAQTGTDIGPLYDDDVAAAWGHIASPQSPLSLESCNTILLTTGTGLAEAHWVDGQFVDKETYPRASEYGLEEKLRGEGWRYTGDPNEALCQLVSLRRERYPLEQMILSGRFVHMNRDCVGSLEERLNMKVQLVDLPEAPALGALQLSQSQ